MSVGIDVSILNRRQFLGGAAAASLAAMLPWDRALAQTKLNFGYMKIGDLSPFFMATEKGLFKEAGLEIALSSMVGGAAIQPALASGAINIGWTNVASMCQGYRKDSWSLTSAAHRGGGALQDGGEEVPSTRDHLEVRAVATAGAVAPGPRA